MITAETRREAYYDVQPKTPNRRWYVYNVLKVHGDMTAEEITNVLLKDGIISRFDLNYVRPRLTELKECGRVETVGRRASETTGKTSAVWRAV